MFYRLFSVNVRDTLNVREKKYNRLSLTWREGNGKTQDQNLSQNDAEIVQKMSTIFLGIY